MPSTKETTACKDCNDPINTCCGDEVCEGTETSTNCPVDCGTVGPLDNYCCGDGVCEGDENLDNCYFDCHNCFFDWECDDDNECTTDVCNGLCEYTPVSDDTTCTGGICCSGDCVTATCSTDSECDDSESCTTDTCVSPGTCSSNCNNNWPGCGLSDSCCGPLCGSEDPDCPQQDCSACHKGVCDGSCNPAKEGPSCPDCV